MRTAIQKCPISVFENAHAKYQCYFFSIGNCLVNMVDEFYTSQTCAKCFGRFDPRTKRHRFKVCQNCQPSRGAMLPSIIVAKKGKRLMRSIRTNLRENGDQLVAIDGQPPNLEDTVRLLSKVSVHRKDWQVNTTSGVVENVATTRSGMEAIKVNNQQPRIWKTVWHRDIVAAKCILIKGLF